MNASHPANSLTATWTGRVLTILVVGMLIFSSAMKFGMGEMVTKEFARLGYPHGVIIALGITELACALIYLVPQTAVLGAILLTGYLGGATATHLRIGDPFWPPVLGGILAWLGLFLREPRLRALIPVLTR